MTPATPIDNFVLSLAVAIADLLGLAGPADATPRALWALEADEAKSPADDAFSVLRPYGGESKDTFAGSRILSASLQVDTRGRTARAALARAWAIYEALLEDDGRPRMHWAIPGKVVDAGTGAVADDADGSWEVREVDVVAVPGVIGRDEDNRHLAPFSFDVEFDRVTD